MFSTVEIDYIKSLVNTYKELGYKYYVCYTVTETNNNDDLCFYFSKNEIKATSDNSFDINNAIIINLDSSTRNDNNYNPSTHSRDILEDTNYTGPLVVNTAEFIYTNAIPSYDSTVFVVNPDICKSGVMNYENTFLSCVIIFILLITFLYNFVLNIIRLRRN